MATATGVVFLLTVIAMAPALCVSTLINGFGKVWSFSNWPTYILVPLVQLEDYLWWKVEEVAASMGAFINELWAELA